MLNNDNEKLSGSVAGETALAFAIIIFIVIGTVVSTVMAVSLEKTDPEPTTQQEVIEATTALDFAQFTFDKA